MLFDPKRLNRPEPIAYNSKTWRELRDSGEYIAQPKYDGVRCMFEYCANGERREWSRHGKELYVNADLCRQVPDKTVIDGEFMPDKTYIPFDVLMWDGEDTTKWSWEDRRDLAVFFCGEEGQYWDKFYRQCYQNGHEGLVLKPRHGGYFDKWFKVKE